MQAHFEKHSHPYPWQLIHGLVVAGRVFFTFIISDYEESISNYLLRRQL